MAADVFVFPASFAQRSLWFVEQAAGTRGAYNISFGLRIRGALDDTALGAALTWLRARHEILRTTITVENGEVVQIVHEASPLELVRGVPTGDPTIPEWELGRLATIESSTAFDLQNGPLIRATLLRLAPRDHALVITMHHAIVDEWSIGVFVRELTEAYGALVAGQPPMLAPLSIQYADFAVWQHREPGAPQHEEAITYWKARLASLPAFELPTDRPRPVTPSFRGARVNFTIGAEIAEPLRRLAREHDATMFMTLLASFQVFLYRHTGQSDFVVGTPSSGRTRRETQGLIGCCLNMLVIRADLSGEPDFRELLGRTRETVLDAFAHHDLPFERLVEALRVARSAGTHPVFQTAFVFRVAEEPLPVVDGLTVERLSLPPSDTAKFDFTLMIGDTGADLDVTIEYSTDLFDRATVERMAERYRVLLAGLAAEAKASKPRGTPVSDLPLLPQSESDELLELWNETATPYPRDSSVVELFEQQVDAAPDAIALATSQLSTGMTTESLTYRELDRRANQLANHLRRRGVEHGASIGLAIERSVAFVVAALAVLKLGAAYVPVDRSLPPALRAKILVSLSAVLVREALDEWPGALPTISMVADAERIAQEPESRPDVCVAATARAYVMYTSGSTGDPKGVVVPHRGIVRLVRNTNYIDITAEDVLLSCSTVSFDAATFEIWGSLLNGARLVLYPNAVPRPDDIATLIRRHRVTTLFLTAGLFHLMVDTIPGGLSGVRQLLAGGDVLSASHSRAALRSLSGGALINAYGPTENTTMTCCHRMVDDREIGDTVPIGRPVSNTRVYVLDQKMRRVPVGVPGELWTSGDGLALGYHRDEALTASRFLPDPFSGDPAARIYRTGDIVRYRNNGVLEFLGRSDTQLKISGFRIEAGAVEHALRRHPDVEQAVVVARPGSAAEGMTLVAYVVPSAGKTPDSAQVKTFLRRLLPDYAIPSSIVSLASLPLTASGKIERSSLPLPHREPQRVSTPDFVQTQVRAVWERVLGITDIGLQDNFFDLGGSSLRGIRLLADIEKAFGRQVPIAMLYQGQTIEAMAAALRGDVVDASRHAIVVKPGDGRDPVFVVPGVDGDALGYAALAGALGSDQSLYALRSVGLDDESQPLDRVEEIASRFIAEMRGILPHGPYNLLGMCMGGIIAYEMAQQLADMGEDAGLLALVDTYPPKLIPRRARMPRLGLRLREIGGSVARRLRTLLKQPTQGVRALREGVAIVSQIIVERDIYRGDRAAAQRTMVARANQRAAANYEPVPRNGDMLLILSSREIGSIDDARLAWVRLATGRTQVVQVAGENSGSVLREPNVRQFAEVLREQLQSSRRSPTPAPDQVS